MTYREMRLKSNLVLTHPPLSSTVSEEEAFSSMKCPYCGYNEDRVLDTREQKDGDLIRRRRECLQCKSRFTTVEMLSVSFPLVIKKDGRREPFSKEKILKGIQAACQKRPISLGQIEAVVEKIANWTLQAGEKEIPAAMLGHKVMLELRNMDDVAYIRFASVYRTFKDVQEFVETLEDQEGIALPESTAQLSLRPERLTFLKGSPVKDSLRDSTRDLKDPQTKEPEHESGHDHQKTITRDRSPDFIPD